MHFVDIKHILTSKIQQVLELSSDKKAQLLLKIKYQIQY